MKKIFLTLLLSLTLIASGLRAEEVQATVMSVSGKTMFINATGQAQSLKVGTLLRSGTRITTDGKGLAILLLADGSKLSLGPNTDLTLSEMTKDGESFGNVFNLLRGLIRASVQKLTVGSKFEVTSSHGVAAVKGTEYEVHVHDDGMDVHCREGKVWLSDRRRERYTEIRELMKASTKNDEPGKATEMKREEIENFGRWANESRPKDSIGDARAHAFWNSLRPDQKLRAVGALREALGETWDEITTLKAEERQERWRERLRDADERNLAGDEAQVDFALRKSMLDRQGRRVRFSEFIIRPAADQIQFLNYTKRDDRTDLVNVVNTYNKNLPKHLGQARDINQKIWYQDAPPHWWVKESTVVFANSGNDSFAGASWFFDPVKINTGCGCTRWELPVQKVELGLNIPDIAMPTLNGLLNIGATGILLEKYERATNNGTGTVLVGTTSSLGTNSLHSDPLQAGNIAMTSNFKWKGGLGFDVGGLGTVFIPVVVRDLTAADLGVQRGDLANGERRTYFDGTYVDIRSYAIDENGKVQNLPDLLEKGLFNAWLTLAFKTYQEVNISSNKFVGLGDIDVVSQMMWWYTITKRADKL